MMRKGIILLLALFLCSGCEKIEPENIQNLSGKILVIGHGGSGFQSFFHPAPANSLLSITQAIDGLGADGVELDVQLTADKKLVLYHDEFLQTQTDCSDCIGGQTAEAVTKCRYTRGAHNQLRGGEPLITLESVLARYAGYPIKPQIFIDCKLLQGCGPDQVPQAGDFATAIADLIAAYNAQAWTQVESNSVPLLQTLKARDSRLRLSFYTRNPAADIPVAASNGFEGITAFNHEITAAQVEEAHRHQLFVTLLGIKARSGLLNTIRKNPDAIQTDNLPLLINMLQD